MQKDTLSCLEIYTRVVRVWRPARGRPTAKWGELEAGDRIQSERGSMFVSSGWQTHGFSAHYFINCFMSEIFCTPPKVGQNGRRGINDKNLLRPKPSMEIRRVNAWGEAAPPPHGHCTSSTNMRLLEFFSERFFFLLHNFNSRSQPIKSWGRPQHLVSIVTSHRKLLPACPLHAESRRDPGFSQRSSNAEV